LGYSTAVEGVADQLAKSASRFARASLAALSTADDMGFALYAATSVEHLTKCYLARKHPALIVDAKSVGSLLHACGQDAVAGTPRDQVKTITAAESVARVSRFVPLLTSHTTNLARLFEIRNGAVHLADSASTAPFVFPFLKASELLRDALGIDRDVYWGEYVTLADKTLREHVEAAELKATAAVGAARAVFAERFGHLLDAASRAAIIAALEPSFWGDEEQPVTCPACESTALAMGTVDAEWHYEQTGDEDFEATFEATFLPDALRCNICRLELTSYEELVAAGVEQRWSIDVDPQNYIDEREPDEDYWRDH
jgi:hypothetical protein